MKTQDIFPFILKSQHSDIVVEKENEIAGLRAQISELNQSINIKNNFKMTDEQFVEIQNSIQTLTDSLTNLESSVNANGTLINDLKKRQTDLESRMQNILGSAGAQSAVALTQVDPVVNSDAPKSVIADIDIVNDFQSALAKIEEEYGK